MSRLAHPHPLLPKLRRGVDRLAHMVSQLGYGFLPITIGSWRRVQVEHNVPYRNTSKRAHLLDIYRPRDAEGPLPSVIYIHGGAFSMMSKDTHRIMAYVLASQGYQVFNINYRLGPVHPYPKPLDDAIAAVLWVLDHGEARGADINRLAIMGESAGANLAAALSYCAAHPRPEPFARALYERNIQFRCVAPMYGILDLHDVERFWRDPRKSRRLATWIKREIHGVTHSYLGRRASRALEFPLASPLRLLESSPPPDSRPLPPFFTTVGTADPLISDTIRLREALDARGTECDLHVFRGEIHAFDVMLWRESARTKWRALFRFLGRHMNVTPTAPFALNESAYPSWVEASAG
jgi:acetyl esterase